MEEVKYPIFSKVCTYVRGAKNYAGEEIDENGHLTLYVYRLVPKTAFDGKLYNVKKKFVVAKRTESSKQPKFGYFTLSKCEVDDEVLKKFLSLEDYEV